MKRLNQIWKSFLASGSLSVTLGISLANVPAIAQSTVPFTGSDPSGNQDLNDVWNNNSGQGASSLFGLINRLQLLNGRSPGDFSAEQNEGFQSAVEEFQKKQQEQLQTPAAVPQPPTPLPSPP